MNRNLPAPQGLEFAVWAAIFTEQYADYGVQEPVSAENWQDWASGLLQFPQLADIPEPYSFSNWQDWASRSLETSIN